MLKKADVNLSSNIREIIRILEVTIRTREVIIVPIQGFTIIKGETTTTIIQIIIIIRVIGSFVNYVGSQAIVPKLAGNTKKISMQEPQANTAQRSDPGFNSNWIMDSRTMHHVTNDL